MAGSSKVREYYRLSKGGIVYGNTMTAIAGFLFAAGWETSHPGRAVVVFVATTLGIGLVIASASVFNNYLDRKIDARMERTRLRPLVTGTISVRNALIYGTALGLIGLALLAFFANLLTAAIALFGWVSYVLIYGWAKRKGWWGAMVGSIPGAVPIIVGYTAVTGRFEVGAFLLFLAMAAWQIPHFYAIALFRKDEYAAAGIPTIVAVKGARAAKDHSLVFMFAFLILSLLLFASGYAGYTYAGVMAVLGVAWIWRGVTLFWQTDACWGKSTFLFSLIVLLGFSLVLAVSRLLP